MRFIAHAEAVPFARHENLGHTLNKLAPGSAKTLYRPSTDPLEPVALSAMVCQLSSMA